MTVTTRPENAFRFRFETFHEAKGASAPSWLGKIRREAIDRFEHLGFPSTRHEDWRFTSVAPIAETDFLLGSEKPGRASAAEIDALALPGMTGPRAVFVDGCFSPEHSDLSGVPAGVTVVTLAQALAEHESLVKPHLARLAKTENDTFTALNTAFLEDGLFVHVPAGVAAKGGITALHVTTSGDEPRMTHPRHLIVLEQGAEVSVVEDYVSHGEGVAFSNAVTEIVVGENATCRHYVLERENEKAYNITTMVADQARDSNLRSHTVLLGGRLVRNNVYPNLRGENCDSLVNGLYVTGTGQLHDNHMRVRHAAPHCDSRQFYRGILDGNGRAIFSGRINVDEGAQKTDAKQTNMNLLLSDDALVETRPQLEIYADDVKCTHGATVGQIDDEAIFYLQARGIPRDEARRLLVFAFANEILDRMDLAPVREALRAMLTERLPAEKLREKAR